MTGVSVCSSKPSLSYGMLGARIELWRQRWCFSVSCLVAVKDSMRQRRSMSAKWPPRFWEQTATEGKKIVRRLPHVLAWASLLNEDLTVTWSLKVSLLHYWLRLRVVRTKIGLGFVKDADGEHDQKTMIEEKRCSPIWAHLAFRRQLSGYFVGNKLRNVEQAFARCPREVGSHTPACTFKI